MSPWRFAIAGGAVTQIAISLIVYSGDLGDERSRLGLAVFGLAGGAALLGLVTRSVCGLAAGLNGLVFLLCVPQLFIGLFEGFAVPAGSPLGGWLYPVVGALASAAAVNAVALGWLHARSLQPNAEPGAASDRGGIS
jgi:hypothetical protein